MQINVLLRHPRLNIFVSHFSGQKKLNIQHNLENLVPLKTERPHMVDPSLLTT